MHGCNSCVYYNNYVYACVCVCVLRMCLCEHTMIIINPRRACAARVTVDVQVKGYKAFQNTVKSTFPW